MTISRCAHCGARVEIPDPEIQGELPLGPIEVFLKSPKNKLDGKNGGLVKSNDYYHYNNDDDDTKKHPLWPKFARYCESRSGNPTVKGFKTWLSSQVVHIRPDQKRIAAARERYEKMLANASSGVTMSNVKENK